MGGWPDPVRFSAIPISIYRGDHNPVHAGPRQPADGWRRNKKIREGSGAPEKGTGAGWAGIERL